jgi:acyl dehydratase
MDIKPVKGEVFTHSFSFSQQDVEAFAKVTGDTNPVHLNEEYAALTPFKKPILHGFLSGSVFSKVFGTIFPGPGSIYVGQTLNFKRPMFSGMEYFATFTITDVDQEKSTLTIHCAITDGNKKACLEGEARLVNRKIFSP